MNGQEKIMEEEKLEAIREEIHARFPDVAWPEPVLEPIYYGRLKKTEIEKRKAIMDVNTGYVWDIVSNIYGLIPHEKALYDVLAGIPEEMGKPEIDLSIWNYGSRFRADIKFPEVGKDVEIKVGDKVRPRFTIQSSYDRFLLHDLEYGAEQLKCTNGLMIFNGKKSSRKHITTAHITPEVLAKLAENFLIEYSEATEQWRKWANRQLTQVELDDVFEALPFSQPEKEKIMALPLMNSDNRFLQQMENRTLWDVNSAATQFTKHEIRGDQRRNDLERDIAIAMSKVGKDLIR